MIRYFVPPHVYLPCTLPYLEVLPSARYQADDIIVASVHPEALGMGAARRCERWAESE